MTGPGLMKNAAVRGLAGINLDLSFSIIDGSIPIPIQTGIAFLFVQGHKISHGILTLIIPESVHVGKKQ
jgi:hypothetical protein